MVLPLLYVYVPAPLGERVNDCPEQMLPLLTVSTGMAKTVNDLTANAEQPLVAVPTKE
jgi:hypothetical protein